MTVLLGFAASAHDGVAQRERPLVLDQDEPARGGFAPHKLRRARSNSPAKVSRSNVVQR